MRGRESEALEPWNIETEVCHRPPGHVPVETYFVDLELHDHSLGLLLALRLWLLLLF